MSEPDGQRRLADELQQAGCSVGISKSNRLLRIDNRACALPLNTELLEQIAGCAGLRELYLNGITGWLNDHIGQIAALKSLRCLDVEGSDLNNASLHVLAACDQLQLLNVRNTRVTPDAIAVVRKRMIATRIIA